MKISRSDSSVPNKTPIMNLANQITILRIVLIPIIVICLLENETIWVISLVIFSMITDVLDGVVARIRKEQSPLGAFLDPLADKLLVSGIYVTMAYLDLIDMWVFVVIFSRDLIIIMGWGVVYILTNSAKIIPRSLGKVTTAFQLVTILVIVYGVPISWQNAFIWITVGFTTASTIEYIVVGEKRLGEWG